MSFYKRWWAKNQILSKDGFKVSPAGERGIFYTDKLGAFVVNARYSVLNCMATYEFDHEDVFAIGKDRLIDELKTNGMSTQRKIRIMNNAKNALEFDGVEVRILGRGERIKNTN